MYVCFFIVSAYKKKYVASSCKGFLMSVYYRESINAELWLIWFLFSYGVMHFTP